jgi:uncharacterized protein YlxW (UPF0749 family)
VGRVGRGTLVWQGLLAVLLMALGFLLVVQGRAGRALSRQENVPTRNVYALAAMLHQEQEARHDLEVQVAGLNRRLVEFETAAARRKSDADAFARELATLRVAAGLVALAGPGITVSVDDGVASVAGQAPPVVQYVDLAGIVNELWAAGAEAIAVNDHRIVASTGFSQVGGTISVGESRLSPPYAITAIGEPDTLQGALSIRGGIVEGLRTLGLRIGIARHATLVIPAAQTLPELHLAHPVAP